MVNGVNGLHFRTAARLVERVEHKPGQNSFKSIVVKGTDKKLELKEI